MNSARLRPAVSVKSERVGEFVQVRAFGHTPDGKTLPLYEALPVPYSEDVSDPLALSRMEVEDFLDKNLPEWMAQYCEALGAETPRQYPWLWSKSRLKSPPVWIRLRLPRESMMCAADVWWCSDGEDMGLGRIDKITGEGLCLKNPSWLAGILRDDRVNQILDF
jgi:hypothetical protein